MRRLTALALVVLASTSSAAVRRQPVRGPVRPPRAGGPVRPDLPTIPPLFSLPDPRCSATTSTGEVMSASLATPRPGTVLTAYGADCPQAVEVIGTGSVGLTFSDLYFVLDSSGSTAACSGFDVDQDGTTGMPSPFGFGCSDGDDTVLAAEVRAVRGFVATLNPATTRVAIIQFSDPTGAISGSERQLIVQSLTSDFTLVDAALDEILFYGSEGATDYGGGLQLVRSELLANGDPANRRQRAYFLSDGIPTYPQFPYSSEDPPDAQTAIDQADVLAGVPLRVDTFGVGFIPTLTQDPGFPRRCIDPATMLETSTLQCIALRTGGEFFASNDPEDIVERLLLSRPAGIESVTIANLTNGVTQVLVPAPDGGFAASVPIEEGVVNRLLVTVRAEDGTQCTIDTDVMALCFAAGACSPLTQGYWHRQCMGLRLIPMDGPGPPPHPDWDPETLLRLMAGVTDPIVRRLGSPPDQSTCEGLDADPPDDTCQKAIKQYSAVLMNIHGGHLAPTCVLELTDIGLVSPDQAASIIEQLIVDGLAGDRSSCQRANDLADSINTGAALR